MTVLGITAQVCYVTLGGSTHSGVEGGDDINGANLPRGSIAGRAKNFPIVSNKLPPKLLTGLCYTYDPYDTTL